MVKVSVVEKNTLLTDRVATKASQETVRQTLTELFRVPDDGLELHEDFAKELKASLNAAQSGRKLVSAESVAANLGLTW
jgi:hypothetical protein